MYLVKSLQSITISNWWSRSALFEVAMAAVELCCGRMRSENFTKEKATSFIKCWCTNMKAMWRGAPCLDARPIHKWDWPCTFRCTTLKSQLGRLTFMALMHKCPCQKFSWMCLIFTFNTFGFTTQIKLQVSIITLAKRVIKEEGAIKCLTSGNL